MTTNNFFLVGNTRGNNVLTLDFSSGGLIVGEFISANTGLLDDPDTLLYGPDANGDGLKDLYISIGPQAATSSILRFDGGDGTFIDTFIGNDPTTPVDETGGLIRPYEFAFGPDGYLYVASFLTDQILRYNAETGDFVDVFAEGNGLAGGLNGPDGLLFIDNSLYVTTQGSIATEDPVTGEVSASFSAGLPSQILRYDSLEAGSTPVVFAMPDPSPDSFGFVSLLGLELGPNDGDLYVSDFAGDLLRYDLESGALVERLGTNFTTTTPPSNNFMGNLVFAPNGDLLTVGFDISSLDGAVLVFNAQEGGSPVSPFELLVPVTGSLRRPIGITFIDNSPNVSPFDDIFPGTDGRDVIVALAGNDIVRGAGGNDRLFGGEGDDQLFGDAGNDRLLGDNGNDQIVGGAGNDRLFGNAGKDELDGQGGNDLIRGGNGADVLRGGSGNDQLAGELGNDLIETGNGNDRIIIRAGEGFDQITDFSDGRDRILLRGLRFANLSLNQRGSDVLIRNDSERLLLLQNVEIEQMTAADFA